MVLSLTRSLASTQLRRTFTHQTWVSGISQAMPSRAVFQHDDILQAHQEPGFLLLRSVLMDFSSLLVFCQVGQKAHFYDYQLNFNLRFFYLRTYVDFGSPQGLQAQGLNTTIEKK